MPHCLIHLKRPSHSSGTIKSWNVNVWDLYAHECKSGSKCPFLAIRQTSLHISIVIQLLACIFKVPFLQYSSRSNPLLLVYVSVSSHISDVSGHKEDGNIEQMMIIIFFIFKLYIQYTRMITIIFNTCVQQGHSFLFIPWHAYILVPSLWRCKNEGATSELGFHAEWWRMGLKGAYHVEISYWSKMMGVEFMRNGNAGMNVRVKLRIREEIENK